jgi:hypothetical protein
MRALHLELFTKSSFSDFLREHLVYSSPEIKILKKAFSVKGFSAIREKKASSGTAISGFGKTVSGKQEQIRLPSLLKFLLRGKPERVRGGQGDWQKHRPGFSFLSAKQKVFPHERRKASGLRPPEGKVTALWLREARPCPRAPGAPGIP